MISNAKGRKFNMAEHDAPAATEAARKRQAEHEEATKKRLADEQKGREKAHAEQRDSLGTVKPTPTQQENDLAASGVHVTEHEPDGSPPDPGVATPAPTRQSEAKPAAAGRGNYSTRSMQPAS
jgi:hypothetical protein